MRERTDGEREKLEGNNLQLRNRDCRAKGMWRGVG